MTITNLERSTTVSKATSVNGDMKDAIKAQNKKAKYNQNGFGVCTEPLTLDKPISPMAMPSCAIGNLNVMIAHE